MFLTKRNKRRDLREVYRATERIQTAETPREADILTGYALGVIDEKFRKGKLTAESADAITEMVEVIGDEMRRDLIAERRAAESGQEESKVFRIAQFQAVAEK